MPSNAGWHPAFQSFAVGYEIIAGLVGWFDVICIAFVAYLLGYEAGKRHALKLLRKGKQYGSSKKES